MSSNDYEKKSTDKKSSDGESVEHIETSLNLNSNPQARIKNPLSGIPRAQLLRNVEAFAREKDLLDQLPVLTKGAVRKYQLLVLFPLFKRPLTHIQQLPKILPSLKRSTCSMIMTVT